jgi:nitrogen fixation NifU-like protein
MYSHTTLDHFHHPRHVGEVEGANGYARLENPVCGDVVEFWVLVRQGCLEKAGFRAFGCAAAIASCSMLAELATGSSLQEVKQMSTARLVEALGGLPGSKTHGAALALETLQAALESC